ncbi:MAG: cation diffusion facilitator family transporter [Deltaproteobacteria bacterium]|nr:cation diffusion facilitator family transporter [Deltaproteobacteria bacterium]
MNSPAPTNLRHRLIAISASLAIGAGLMVVKFIAFGLTDSAAILSDALESIINVVAAGFALWSIIFAARSPDPDHPDGHGKMEYFSAGFEGALIILAALGIFYEAWPRLFHPQAIPRLTSGILLVLGAAVVNLILGLALVMVGKRTRSIVLVADGKHVLTDVYTTVGVVIGLIGVKFTGWNWLDGAVAYLVGANHLFTGARLVHQSSAALLDTSDPRLLQEICEVISQHRRDIWIDVHQLRARRSGYHVFMDFHLILPRDLSLEASHDEVKKLEKILSDHFEGEADILIHADPCTDPECPICGHEPCDDRRADHKLQRLWTSENLTCSGSREDQPSVSQARERPEK